MIPAVGVIPCLNAFSTFFAHFQTIELYVGDVCEYDFLSDASLFLTSSGASSLPSLPHSQTWATTASMAS